MTLFYTLYIRTHLALRPLQAAGTPSSRDPSRSRSCTLRLNIRASPRYKGVGYK